MNSKVDFKCSAGGIAENQDGQKRRFLKLKNPAKIWKNRKQQNHTDTAGQNQQNFKTSDEPTEPLIEPTEPQIAPIEPQIEQNQWNLK